MQDTKQGKSIYLIRHGQSEGNAGLRTDDHRTIALTPLGREQAEEVSRAFAVRPERIAASPFRRAQETARPTSARFHLPIETWHDAYEFTYLNPASCIGTTREERLPRVEAYWREMNPESVDGAGAESFRTLTERALAVWERLRQAPEKTIFLFSHEMFLKCLCSVIEKPDLALKERMVDFWHGPHIANCEVIRYDI